MTKTEELEATAEMLVEIAEGSGDPFAETIVGLIAELAKSKKHEADELTELLTHVAETIKGLNSWRLSIGMKAV